MLDTNKYSLRPRPFALLLLSLCFAPLLAIEAPEEMAAASVQTSLAAEVEGALETSTALLEAHRGYVAYLEDHGGVATAEQAWLDLNTLAQFRPLASAFDEALHQDPAAQTLFDQYYDQIARDPGLRASVDALQRSEFGMGKPGLSSRRQRGAAASPSEAVEEQLRLPIPPLGSQAGATPDLFSSAFNYLRANPDEALRFFENPRRLKPIPRSLYPLLGHFEGHPELLEELLGSFRAVTANPLAHTRVFPWWQAAAAPGQGTAEAYAQLTAHFLNRPHHFWVWHQRNIALADDAHARTWIRHWHREVRRAPGLVGAYERYLYERYRDPAQTHATEARWQTQFGPAPTWPPKHAPPVLPRLKPRRPAAATPRDGIRRPSYMRPEKPHIEKPTITRPTKPTMPSMPTMPTRPQKPAPPPRPTKPDSEAMRFRSEQLRTAPSAPGP